MSPLTEFVSIVGYIGASRADWLRGAGKRGGKSEAV
jgi:hypothetical protein